MEDNLTTTLVDSIPDCQFAHGAPTPAAYDGKTTMGPWAYMCEVHHMNYGCGVGTGRGQKLVLRTAPASEADK